MSHLAAAASPKNIRLKFSRGDTIDIEMKEIGCRRITSRELSNSHFPPYFYWDYEFLSYTDSSACRSTAPMMYLDQYILM